MTRSHNLQLFVDACSAAYGEFSAGGEAAVSSAAVFERLKNPMSHSARPGNRLPVCRFLPPALDAGRANPALEALIEAFTALEPELEWREKPSFDRATASGNFVGGHANAMILGPGGIEERSDVWLGVSLMAPDVRYPDHDHAPEEVYLVLSEGEFFQEGRGWFSPGIGGMFFNRPAIRHAMRSGSAPLLAIWALRVN